MVSPVESTYAAPPLTTLPPFMLRVEGGKVGAMDVFLVLEGGGGGGSSPLLLMQFLTARSSSRVFGGGWPRARLWIVLPVQGHG